MCYTCQVLRMGTGLKTERPLPCGCVVNVIEDKAAEWIKRCPKAQELPIEAALSIHADSQLQLFDSNF